MIFSQRLQWVKRMQWNVVQRGIIIGLIVVGAFSILIAALLTQVRININVSKSLKESIFISEVRRSDRLVLYHDQIVLFRWRENTKTPVWPKWHNQLAAKRIVGMPGDFILSCVSTPKPCIELHRKDTGVVLKYPVKRFTRAGMQLTPIQPQVIEPLQYFVTGDGPDSYDSRYEEIGLVDFSRLHERVLFAF